MLENIQKRMFHLSSVGNEAGSGITMQQSALYPDKRAAGREEQSKIPSEAGFLRPKPRGTMEDLVVKMQKAVTEERENRQKGHEVGSLSFISF